MEKDYYISAHELKENYALRGKILLILLDSIAIAFSHIQHLPAQERDDHIINIEQISRSLVRVQYLYPIAFYNYPERKMIEDFEEAYNSSLHKTASFLSEITDSELLEVNLFQYRIRGYNVDIKLLTPSANEKYYSILLSVDLEILLL